MRDGFTAACEERNGVCIFFLLVVVDLRLSEHRTLVRRNQYKGATDI